jgi:hypothetical protein
MSRSNIRSWKGEGTIKEAEESGIEAVERIGSRNRNEKRNCRANLKVWPDSTDSKDPGASNVSALMLKYFGCQSALDLKSLLM